MTRWRRGSLYTPGRPSTAWCAGGGASWVAFINSKKKKYHLGSFATYEEAVAARKAAEEAIARGEEPQHSGVVRPNTCGSVYFRDGRWEAYIQYKGRRRYLGRFDTNEEARAARKAAEEAIARGEEPQRIK